MAKSLNHIRSSFLDFFGAHEHAVLPSSSLVPHNDPTLMFANAGMNQFKDIFTGNEKAKFPRATTAQKVVRAGGKHNDLDNVGYTARHHTFFEMLGNFSFGDYFKEQAISLAWKLLTEEWKLDKSKLTFTVYHTDDEAFSLWKKITGCDDARILRVPTKDNFWAMGDTGPCGPCSEIFYDHGVGEGQWGLNADGSDKFGERFVEIWNLVFMQFNAQDDGKQVPLPKPSIDTGMGLERISAVLQGVHDNYEIDLFKTIIAAIKQEAGARGEAAAYKVIADHLRSSCFLIADGVLPSNEGRGYVLRRIMRRAMRYAHQLGCKEPLMYRLVPSLVNEMGEAYPELKRAQATITENLRAEEERFKDMLGRGLKLLEDETAKLKVGGVLPGEAAFKLYDTYGFPLDLTQDILRGRGMTVDEAGFETSMEEQRERARAAWTGSGEKATGALWFALKEKIGATEFLGYDAESADAVVRAIVKGGAEVDAASAGDEVEIVLDRTPFYGESGGQIGDTGEFAGVAKILDTKKPLEHLHVHYAKVIAPLKVGDKVKAAIDAPRRAAIRANHSATHLMHKALRDVLGEHVTQKGSLVAPDRLRFDFSHGKAVTAEELKEIEKRVNAQIAANAPVDITESTPDEAIKAGAMALFGEKYGDKVRVLSMGLGDLGLGIKDSTNPQSPIPNPYSVELCGGTHVKSTGEIGAFKFISEGSVASGIRRVQAVTHEGVRKYVEESLKKSEAQMAALGGASGVRRYEDIANASLQALPALYEEVLAEQSQVLATLQEQHKQRAKLEAEAKKQAALSAGTPAVQEGQFIYQLFDGLEPKELRGVAETLLKKVGSGVAMAATTFDGKGSVVVASSQGNAPALVQKAVEALGGKGGGGKPEMAQGGGPQGDQLAQAVEAVKRAIGG